MTGNICLRIYVLIGSLLITSCATKQPDKTGLPQLTFSSISLISQSELVDIANSDTKTERAMEGLETGALAGTYGGIAASAACGPFWGLCAFPFALVGGFAGGVTGAVYGGVTGISEDDSVALVKKMELLEHDWGVQTNLVENVKQRLPSEMLSEPEESDVHAVLFFESVGFHKHDKAIVLKSHARLTFTLNKSVTEPAIGSKIFSGHSHAADIDDWLEYEPKELQQAMEQSLEVISKKVAAALIERWAI